MRSLITVLLIFLVKITFAQEEVRCSHKYRDLTIEQKALLQKQLANGTINSFRLSEDQILVIPVVVHVVYSNDAEYINYDQIKKQIEVLNQDYRRLNWDTALTPAGFKSVASDVGIEFRLAQKDPSGKPTVGVTFTKTKMLSFSDGDEGIKSTEMGGSDPWDPNKYLNIWVGDLTSGSSRLLGYVPYPNLAGTNIDGVAISYTAFSTYGTSLNSRYNLGRTVTHEVGHWLDLLHLWGLSAEGSCDTDYVDDTPSQRNETSSALNCPVYPYKPADNCNNDSRGRMFSNYMDYTRDACMNMFSKGQAQKMLSFLTAQRPSILTSNVLSSPYKNDLAIVEILYDTLNGCGGSGKAPQIRIKNVGSETVFAYSLQVNKNDQTQIIYGNGKILPGGDTLIEASELTFSSNSSLINATLTSTSPSQDEFMANNTKSFACGVVPLGIYPNPADTKLYVSGNRNKVKSIKLYNLTGDEMLSFSNEQEMDISGLLPGFYVTVFVTTENSVRHQLIIVH